MPASTWLRSACYIARVQAHHALLWYLLCVQGIQENGNVAIDRRIKCGLHWRNLRVWGVAVPVPGTCGRAPRCIQLICCGRGRTDMANVIAFSPFCLLLPFFYYYYYFLFFSFCIYILAAFWRFLELIFLLSWLPSDAKPQKCALRNCTDSVCVGVCVCVYKSALPSKKCKWAA